ncbi:outer membrane beta-barrel protein [Rubrolithibacter danxiaensis]|uniref:outer membrane beta-barrel protein n=1 Tax=Rubrolithibacter danxiaensis TaxID=3390805 RepID=UPI003BF8FADE
MKKILLAVLIAFTTSFAFSQESSSKGKTKFSIGLEAGIPVGNAGDLFGLAIGGSAKVEVPVAPSFFVTGSAGFINLSYKKDIKDAFEVVGIDAPSQNFIPVKAGGKYFFNKNIYGAGELGVAIGTADGAGTAFAWTPGVGVVFPVSDKTDFDAGVRYESWSDNGSLDQVAFRVALRF